MITKQLSNREFMDKYLHPLFEEYRKKEFEYFNYKWKFKDKYKKEYEDAKENYYDKIREYEYIKKINSWFKEELLLNY